MKNRFTTLRDRRAIIAPLAALLMTFLVGMLAFSIDIGYICSVQAELQDAADAAALAGAQQLQTPFVAYYSPGLTSQQQQAIYLTVTTDTTNPLSAIPSAQQYAAYNQAGGVYIQVPTTDVSLGYYDGTTFSAPSFTSNMFPNTVTVTTRRDNVANGPLGLFFGQIFGMSSTNMTATASATIYAGDVSSLQPLTNVNAHILPVALCLKVWQDYANGILDSPWLEGVVTIGPNGNPQLQVYIQSTNTPGSFGLLDVGPPANNTPAFRNWIDSGTTPNDISYLASNSLLPVSPSAPQPWKAGPGLTSTLLTNFQSQIGVPNLIPLFVQVSPPSSSIPTAANYVAATSTGSNATYAIVGFAGVTISQAVGSGGNMTISIQPAAIVDPTAVILNATPARFGQPSALSPSATGSTSPSGPGMPPSTFVSAKLTR